VGQWSRGLPEAVSILEQRLALVQSGEKADKSRRGRERKGEGKSGSRDEEKKKRTREEPKGKWGPKAIEIKKNNGGGGEKKDTSFGPEKRKGIRYFQRGEVGDIGREKGGRGDPWEKDYSAGR